MKWIDVKEKLPARSWWVIGCKADESLPIHSRLVRVRLRRWRNMVGAMTQMWDTFNGVQIPLDTISHWAKIETPPSRLTITKLGLGDKVRRLTTGDVYIVATGGVDYVGLINVKNGKQWRKPIFSNDKYNITGEDIKRLLGSATFELVKE